MCAHNLANTVLLYSGAMAWIILIALVVIGYFALKSWAAYDEIKQSEWRDNKLDEFKTRVYKYHNDTIAGYSDGEPLIGMTKKETGEKIIEWQTEVEKIRLWDKHLKTIEASDTFSRDSKNQVQNAWFDYLSTYNSMVQGMKVGVGDPWEEWLDK